MEISVYSRSRLMQEIKAGETFENCLIISFSDPGCSQVDLKSVRAKVFQFQIPDIDYDELADYGMTYDTFWPEASELAKEDFRSYKGIICQCDYGQSRSAGCAAAIAEFFEHRGIEYFASFDYYPSKLVYNRLMDEFIK